MWRRLLIKILFRLLAQKRWTNYAGLNKKMMEQWLDAQFTDMGFREYFKFRDIELMKAMSVGVSRQTYDLLLGEKLEIMKMLQRVEEMYRKRERDRKAKEREAAKEKERIKRGYKHKGRSKIINK